MLGICFSSLNFCVLFAIQAGSTCRYLLYWLATDANISGGGIPGIGNREIAVVTFQRLPTKLDLRKHVLYLSNVIFAGILMLTDQQPLLHRKSSVAVLKTMSSRAIDFRRYIAQIMKVKTGRITCQNLLHAKISKKQ